MNNNRLKKQTDHPGRLLFQLSIIILVLIGLSSYPADKAGIITVSASSGCASSVSSNGSYTVTLCFTSPNNGDTLTGDVTVTATASVTTGGPGIARLVFYLDNNYLLTDFQPIYSFTLPTVHWIDGQHNLAVEAVMRDGFTTPNRGSVNLHFNNGITSPPVNNNSFSPALGTNPGGNPLVVAAVGDGAGGETNETNVVNLISSWNPNLLLYLGDVYEEGSYTEFYNWYGTGAQYYSKFRSITDPTIGNHEYLTSASNYYFYWNNVPNYYSFTTGSWHFVSLNSMSHYVGTSTSSAQYQWLAADLSANTAPCTMVFWHEPLYNVGPEGDQTGMQAIWSLLVQDKVDIVLNGHDHDYQRWKPLDGAGNVNLTSGITEFIAGGGGHSIQSATKSDNRLVV